VRPGLYARAVLAFGVLSIVLGVALLVETVSVGGGSVGYLLGVLFVGLGIARIYVLRRR
jgi:uncharacterized membrane protein HdeD (DUF308 family)